jgi:hypothetical protein
MYLREVNDKYVIQIQSLYFLSLKNDLNTTTYLCAAFSRTFDALNLDTLFFYRLSILNKYTIKSRFISK